MSEDKTAADKIEAFQKLLKAKHKVRMAAITMQSGGFAYMRAPTRVEHDTFQSLVAGATPEETGIAFLRYVEGCFAGAMTDEGKEIDLAEVEALEGPAFVVPGALCVAVNRMAGAGAAPTKYF
jgi:hypothetical protein